ncbi:hypothetical protein COCNU_02G001200 [Cocos nucifera]|uniref:Uncharacterized protein n=1 Tax=Cocos nucifera TaxID=13894 RepID=A0A8K0HY67_COCNU|nr:hypothetical protein COCNU_02G001200 [Cocos nucifera]
MGLPPAKLAAGVRTCPRSGAPTDHHAMRISDTALCVVHVSHHLMPLHFPSKLPPSVISSRPASFLSTRCPQNGAPPLLPPPRQSKRRHFFYPHSY